MSEDKKKQNTLKLRRVFEGLSKPIFHKENNNKLGELPIGTKVITINQSFLEDFLKDAREGKRWNEEAAMHWTEILTFPFSKMIITFDLGVLAFIGVMREEFFNQTILILSIVFTIASLLILSFLIRNIIVKNINSLAERGRILNYTSVLAPKEVKNKEDVENVAEFMKKQAESLRKNLGELEEHAKIGLPWQRVGVYLFYASILSVLIGIIF